MANLNKVMLMGKLTRDIEIKTLPSGASVGSFGMAINRKWKNAQGEAQEEVAFVDVTAFGKTAEVMAQYLHKGSSVYVEGRLKLDQWQDKDGGNRSKLKVVVDEFQFIGGNAGGGDKGRGQGKDGGAKPSGGAKRKTGADAHVPISDEDIAF